MTKTATQIKEYSETEAALGKLKERMKNVVYQVTTTAGMEQAKKDRRELVTLRTSLEAERKRIKAPALEHCRLIDAEAKRLTEELLLLEKPIDEVIKAEEARKEEERQAKLRIEQERVARIQQRIDVIKNAPLVAVNRSADEIELAIQKINAIEISKEVYQEFEITAVEARVETVATLQGILDEKRAAEAEAARLKAEQEAEAERLRIEREKFEKEKAEEERKAAEDKDRLDAIRTKLDALRDVYVTPGMTASEIETLVEAYKAKEISPEKYQEYYDEAFRMHQAGISHLCQLHASAVEQEEHAAKMKLEKEEAEAERAKIAAERAEQEKEASRIAEETKRQEEAKAEAERIERERIEAEKAEAERITLAKKAEKQAKKLADPVEVIRLVNETAVSDIMSDSHKISIITGLTGAFLEKQGKE